MSRGVDRVLGRLYRAVYPRLSGSGIHRFTAARWLDRHLMARLRSRRAQVEGFDLELDPGDSLRISIVGGYEPETTALVKRLLRPGDVAADVGAHIGYFTVLFSKLVGERGQVHAFEPDPESFAILRRNVTANRCANVVVANQAVADAPGPALLYRSPDNAADHRIFPAAETRATLRVEATSLDRHFEDRSPRLDLVKMDVQGAEPAVLAGMEGLLARNPGLRLILEYQPDVLARSGSEPRELLEAMVRRGFRLHPIGPEGRLESPLSVDALDARYRPEKRNFANLCAQRNPT